MAHNAEAGQYRGLTAQQRTEFLTALNSGMTPDDAAKQAGATIQSLAAVAANNGELRAALDGQPVAVQSAARKGDYLAALTRTGGVMEDALLLARLDKQTVAVWRKEDREYASAEDAVLRWLASVRTSARRPRLRMTDEQLDHAASLLEQGETLRATAKVLGVSSHGLRLASARHARLASVMPAPQPQKGQKGRPSGLTTKVEDDIRSLWAVPDITKGAIARQLGVTAPTLREWARSLGLPPDRGRTTAKPE
jgi:transposase-like protein